MTTTTTPEVRYLKNGEQIWVLDPTLHWKQHFMHWDHELKMYYSCPAYEWGASCPDDESEGPGRHVFARYFFRALDETSTEHVYSVPRMVKQLVEAAGDYLVFDFDKKRIEYAIRNVFPAPGPIPKPILDIERAIAGLDVDHDAAKAVHTQGENR